jgi:hypothetical protein
MSELLRADEDVEEIAGERHAGREAEDDVERHGRSDPIAEPDEAGGRPEEGEGQDEKVEVRHAPVPFRDDALLSTG